MNTDLLNVLYEKYNIASSPYGVIGDKLGDVYEEFVERILYDTNHIACFNSMQNMGTLEYEIFIKILEKNDISRDHTILSIKTSTNIPHRLTGGNPKTDILANIEFTNGAKKVLRISSKQSAVKRVAMAEFDTNTICEEMHITDERLKELLLKFQIDASAKRFTSHEKAELCELLKPIARNFVRWVITGCKDENPADIAFPTSIIKFETTKPKDRTNINVASGDCTFKAFRVYTIEEYIDTIMLDAHGRLKKGGFGTGLSWTYATGSKGKKIQFKG